jgi:chloramphenicol 3-O-phosphotransferase
MADEAKIIVVSGVQGAGKSTVGLALAKRFARGAYIDADTLHSMIVAGKVWVTDTSGPGEKMHEEGARQLRLRLHNCCLLARSFRDAGFTVVFGDIVLGERWQHVREDLTGVPFFLVVLAPSVDAVIARDAARSYTVGAEWGKYLDTELRETMAGIGVWIDSSDQTVDETVDEIMQRLDEGLIES